MKEDLVGKNIVFVYITNPTSPQTIWANMIPDIRGEHYRVSNDECNFLASKFNVSGIPHYVLVGKDGKVISPAFERTNNEGLKLIFEKYMKE